MRPHRLVVCAVCLTVVLLLVFYFNQPILSYFATLGETLFHGHRSNITIYVPNNYTSIQAAVDSAIAGDTIHVAAGTYLEEVVVNKDNLKILGEDPDTTTVDGSLGIGLHVEADNTIISGFTIRNSGTGLSLFKSSNCSIYGNHVTLNKFGILLSYSSSCNIYENNVTDNEHNIRLDFSTDNYLANNTISSNHYNFGVDGGSLEHFIQRIDKSNTVNGKAIYYIANAGNLTVDCNNYPDAGCLVIVNSSKVAIKDLAFSNNLDGILLAYTSESTIENVSAIDNKVGIELYSCVNCTVSSTVALYNAYQGIKLVYSPECRIHGNNVTTNTEGLYMAYSNNCTVDSNDVKSNDYGLKLNHVSSSSFFHNNIIDNVRQTYVNDSSGNLFDNGSEGNHWSDHISQDSNHDGICDTPYILADGTSTDRYPLMSAYPYQWNP